MTRERSWRGCVFIGVSLDGFIAKPDGDLGWLTELEPRDHAADAPGQHPALDWDSFFPTIDTLVMGRTTYDTVLGFGEWPFEGKRVVVLSTTLEAGDDRITVAGSLDETVTLLDEAGAGRVYIDGGRTIQAFLGAGLVDEITVSVAPVLIGSGARLFGDLAADVRLRLRGTHATPEDGLVRITYDVLPR
ncbi:Dihydrofolate reductase [Plantibacter flavus]|uniref:Dihydrofolate reductase n=1 Tax=Plantibacter flavus TaxID=150123 RepID=A0A3N2C7U1_9MICO|nr:dihydrofolate reductase family protein [Plantibacter flavus]ROR83578.1 dihydrofolate reductase [Plantibacter flavus]SMG25065.1 Dihydrofolate reductase [Plantibacter flavus]